VVTYRGITNSLAVGFGEGLVPFGSEGLYLPPHYAFEVDDPGCPYLIEIRVAVIEGQPRCADLRLQMRPGGSPVSSENLRKIPLARYVRESPRLYAVRADFDENGEVMFLASTGVEDFTPLDRAARQRPRRAMTPDLLRDVARVYLEAESKPTQAVMRRFSLSRPTAGRWVGLARKGGFIPTAPNEKESEQ
jgi:hypothetical protein